MLPSKVPLVYLVIYFYLAKPGRLFYSLAVLNQHLTEQGLDLVMNSNRNLLTK